MENILEEMGKYCLNCINKPCSNLGCPLNNDIPGFIHEKDTKKAYEIISKTSVLPAVCGRICPHFKQCQGKCVRGIKGKSVDIGQVEARIADIAIKENYKLPKHKIVNGKVAIIGSGPSGLTAAGFLAMNGVNVTIYEKQNNLGGLLAYGIPDFRLDRDVLKNTINKILELGVNAKLNCELEKDIKLTDLQKQYNAIYLCFGANEPNKTFEGENVLSGNKLLEKYNELKEKRTLPKDLTEFEEKFRNKNVVINGGGNVAIDTARTLKRIGANVTVVYRRSEKEMPAEAEEINKAKKENINFSFQNNIISFKNKKLELIKTKLIQSEKETMPYPVNIENSNYTMDCDYLILATGSRTNSNLIQKLNLKTNEKGYVKVNEDYETSLRNVYAGGDLIGTRQTVAYAARNGRDVAYKIIEKLRESKS